LEVHGFTLVEKQIVSLRGLLFHKKKNKKEEKMNFEVKEFKKFFSLVFKKKTLKKEQLK
jgi:hypothetical protein